jgi:hypothetical protein
MPTTHLATLILIFGINFNNTKIKIETVVLDKLELSISNNNFRFNKICIKFYKANQSIKFKT